MSSNPSTGYAWAWTNRRAARAVDSSAWSYQASQAGMPGSAGGETWTFFGKNRGIDSIRMEYRREWEPNSTQKQRTIVIRVQ